MKTGFKVVENRLTNSALYEKYYEIVQIKYTHIYIYEQFWKGVPQ